jgi:probable rRNA maturation factor
MEINVLVDDELKDKLEIGWLRGVAEQVLTALNVDASVELSLFIATGKRVKQLNRDYLGRDEPTDVLAFSAREEAKNLPPFVQPPDGVLHLGEVIIAYPQAVAQAEEYKHSLKREMATLIVHGVLHLLGYEHDAPEAELKMRAREKEIMDRIGGLIN